MDALDIAAPQYAAAKKIAKIVGAVIAAGLLGWWLWVNVLGPREAVQKSEQVEARGKEEVSNAGANAAKDAIPTIVNNNYYTQKSDRQTQENRDAILKSPGADTPVDPALAAVVRRAICLRPSASSLSGCRALLGTAAGGLDENRSGERGTAGE